MMQVLTKEEIRTVLFESCEALNLSNLPKVWIDYFENAYARKNELPYDLDAAVTDEYVFEVQAFLAVNLILVEDEKKRDELMDIGIFFLYLWQKKNSDEFPKEV